MNVVNGYGMKVVVVVVVKVIDGELEEVGILKACRVRAADLHFKGEFRRGEPHEREMAEGWNNSGRQHLA